MSKSIFTNYPLVCRLESMPCLKSLKDIVADLYKNTCKNGNSTVAYKGGHFEKDLLASLSIPAVNLEKFGCPKATSLIRDMVWLETCGCHVIPEAYDNCGGRSLCIVVGGNRTTL